MRNHRTYCLASLSLIASLSLAGAGIAAAQGADDREKLLDQQKELNTRIERLRSEQDYLIFLKAISISDSKYLIINLAAKTGQLKYKNRILKDFQIVRLRGRVVMPAPGAVTLTNKIEEPQARNALVFGKSFILQGRRPPSVQFEAGMQRFAVPQKDFLSIFYAVEAGAKAYILP